MTSANDFTRLVPGFDFLQGLMKSGGTAMPGIGQWIAPTLDPEELQRRIDELRTVQFWLEQNGKLIGTTIQALEVQRMTLATLKGMNLPMADLTQSLWTGQRAATAARSGAAPAKEAKPPPAASAAGDAKAAFAKPTQAAKAIDTPAAPAAAVDPLQWWGALTKQFTELATQALSDGNAQVARQLAGTAMKQGLETANSSIERAMAMSGQTVGAMAKATAAQAPGAVGAVGSAGTARATTATRPPAKAAKAAKTARAAAAPAAGAFAAPRRRKA
ncbi:MAG: hypothetical protein JNL30_09920 [Rubrivivax sp.]|nr:hypothetical protein [Rubrivivax sp.]